MVNLTQILMLRGYGPYTSVDKVWRKRQTLKMSAHFFGRSRNCFSIAIRRLHRSLVNCTKARQYRKEWSRELWETRIHSSCKELGYLPEGSDVFLESLARSDIVLNRQTLANLAIWEPRTFKSINKVAAVKARKEGLTNALGPIPRGIFTRGML